MCIPITGKDVDEVYFVLSEVGRMLSVAFRPLCFCLLLVILRYRQLDHRTFMLGFVLKRTKDSSTDRRRAWYAINDRHGRDMERGEDEAIRR